MKSRSQRKCLKENVLNGWVPLISQRVGTPSLRKTLMSSLGICQYLMTGMMSLLCRLLKRKPMKGRSRVSLQEQLVRKLIIIATAANAGDVSMQHVAFEGVDQLRNKLVTANSLNWIDPKDKLPKVGYRLCTMKET